MRWLAGLLFCMCASAQTAEQAEKANRAKALLSENRFAEAAALYGELTRAIPGNPGLLLNYGMALHMAAKDSEAIAPLEAALKIDPKISPAQLFLGASYLRTGQPAKALPLLEKFAAVMPDHVEARQMLVDAATLSGQPQRALPHLQKLLQLQPRQPALWYRLGRTYEEAAQAEFARLEKLYPESGPFFALLGASRNKTNQRRAAFFFYRKALEKSPTLRGIRPAIAEIYRADGRPEWALHEEALEAKLPALNCAVKTAECEFRAGRYESAARLAQGGNTVNHLYWRVQAYNALAARCFERLMALPESPEAFRWVAETHRDQGRHAEAAQAWQEALRLAPMHPDYRRELAAAWMQMKLFPEAQQIISQLLAAEPGAPDLNHLQGDLFLAQQLPEKAIPFLEKAVAAEPNALPLRASLARAYLLAGEAQKAVPHVNAALPLDSDGSLHFQLARAYQAAGKAAEARDAMAKYQQIQSRNRAQTQAAEEALQITPP